jgi:hypothetical protein
MHLLSFKARHLMERAHPERFAHRKVDTTGYEFCSKKTQNFKCGFGLPTRSCNA